MPFGYGMSCECCETPASPCDICTDASAQLQCTISGVSQVSSPPIETDPPCACTTLNTTFVLDYASAASPVGDCISDTADTRSCLWSSAEELCSGTGIDISYSVDAFLYDKGGDVYVLVSFIIFETDAADGLTAAWNYEGIAMVASGVTQLDCSTIDVTVSLSSSCGGPDSTIWCGGTIEARIQGVP